MHKNLEQLENLNNIYWNLFYHKFLLSTASFLFFEVKRTVSNAQSTVKKATTKQLTTPFFVQNLNLIWNSCCFCFRNDEQKFVYVQKHAAFLA